MSKIITGIITSIFPDDINTDDIIPACILQESLDPLFFKKYAFSNYDKNFVKRCEEQKHNIVIAGENFGCGSSREQAVLALLKNNVKVILAKSFPDIFHRNALNNGLVLITIKNISCFKKGSKLSIDLEKKTIQYLENSISFKMKEQEAKIFAMGGKIQEVQKVLKDQIANKKLKKVNYTSRKEAKNPQTMVEKIVSNHVGHPSYRGDYIKKLAVDVLFFNEVIAPPSINQFYEYFSKVFESAQKKPFVFDAKKIFFIPDHSVPSCSIKVSEGIAEMEEFAKRMRIKCYRQGDGIEHVVLTEDGYIVPGSIVLGTDSHTGTNGALNTLSFGVGTTDACFAMATGFLFDFCIPSSIRVNLKGKFQKGVYAKDLILHLIGQLGADGASKKVVEFGGSGLKNLSMDARTTISNMAVEMGARSAIFEPDLTLENYVKNRAKFPYKNYKPDKNCSYDHLINVDLSTLEPCVSFPHKPANTTTIGKINNYMKKSMKSKSKDFAKVSSLKITDAFLGACTNGRYEDFCEAAKILKGRKVHKNVNFVAIPASRKVYNKLIKEGILSIFAKAGVNIESANCGPCFGKHMGIVGKGAQMISSSNRNYIGRMGSTEAKIFLASPATVAASAVEGSITDPRKYL